MHLRITQPLNKDQFKFRRRRAIIAAAMFVSLFLMIAPAPAQSVIITSKKTTYRRPKPLVEFKKTFTVNYPRVRAASPALSRKIESSISYQKVLGLNIREELTDVQWLEEADYDVGYNARGILSVTLFISGSGAYPSGVSKTVVVDLKTGNTITPALAFRNPSSLAAEIRNKQKNEIEDAIVEIRKDPDFGSDDPAELFKGKTFSIKDLNEFAVDDEGVTFIYDYVFPHVIQALQPEGKFKFTWKVLSAFVKSNGPLGKFIR